MLKKISFVSIIFVLQFITLQLSAQATFDKVKVHSFICNDDSFIIKWYSTGKKPAPEAKAFRFNEPADKSVVTELTGKLVTYRMKDTAWFVYYDSVMWLPKTKAVQVFIVPHDTLGVAGESSEVALAGNVGYKRAAFSSVTTERAKNTNAAIIQWKFNTPEAVKGYSVFRSTSHDNGFEKIVSLSANEFSYTDINLVPDQLYYYYVEAEPVITGYNKRSNTVFEVTYDPSIPLTPSLRSARAGLDGVILTIDVADINAAGVIIYRNDGHSAELKQISQLVPPTEGGVVTYVDSSRYISGNLTYTYAVKAESKSYIRSEYSNKERVKPVSTEFPAAPAGLNAFEEDGKVRMVWSGGSDDEDIAGYIISRKTGTQPFEVIAGYPSVYGSNYYVDSLITTGLTYMYKVESINFQGLRSLSGSVVTCTIDQQLPIAPSTINAIKTGQGIVLEWSETIYDGLESYKVYRYQPGKDPQLLSTVPIDKTTYTDLTATKGTWYYYLTTTDKRNLESAKSVEVGVVW